MSLRDKMKKQRKDLANRHKESVGRKDQGQFGTILLRSKIPEGIKQWIPDFKQHIYDVIPFELAGQINNPKVKAGDLEFVLDVWVHRRVGPTDRVFVCPAQTWNKPCPICTDIKQNDYDKDTYNEIKAKRYTYSLVWVHDSPTEEKEGIKILEIPYFFVQQHLDEISQKPRGGGYVVYSDIDEGKSICFTKKGGKGNVQFTGHQFIDRDGPIPDHILDQSFSLDGCIHWHPTFEEIANAYHGTEIEPTGEPNDVPYTEEDPHESPVKEEVGEREEEEPTGSCPYGGKFGEDTDTLQKCEKCGEWKHCATESMARKRMKRAENTSSDPEPQEESSEQKSPRKKLRRRSD
jgi:hypothetical protein